MASLYENSKERLIELYARYKQNNGDKKNEAMTRLQLIDDIFFECLGWDKRDDCEVEDSENGDYADYVFRCSQRILIVEAKKEGIYFDIPPDLTNGIYKIKTLEKDIPHLGKAINQVANYCQKRGVPFACVCNGHQMVIFIGSRQDGQSPFNGKAIVFQNFEMMIKKFDMLWKAISKEGVLARNILKMLSDSDSVILPKKLSESSLKYPYPGNQYRNELQIEMQVIADLIFEEIIPSEELESQFLEKCYCQSGALSQYALISKELLSNRYESLFPQTEQFPNLLAATNKKGTSRKLLDAVNLSRRPIIILGDVGVGKTIFFRHFINIEAKDIFKNAIQIYIDFGTKATLSKDLQNFVLDEIERQLQSHDCQHINIKEDKFVRGVYHKELLDFQKGIHGRLKEIDPLMYQKDEINFLKEKIANKEQHLIQSMYHISRGRKQQIVIFLDNADQREDDFQQKIFIIAQDLANNWPVTVFLALRPETFYRSKQTGVMSAYQLKAYTIAPPKIENVLDSVRVKSPFSEKTARLFFLINRYSG